jgi:hypothetical protein
LQLSTRNLKPAIRNLTRPLCRSSLRAGFRMLGGAREPDWLAVYCRLITLVLKLDEDLRPFMQEQQRLFEDWLRKQKVEALINKVYRADSQNQ